MSITLTRSAPRETTTRRDPIDEESHRFLLGVVLIEVLVAFLVVAAVALSR